MLALVYTFATYLLLFLLLLRTSAITFSVRPALYIMIFMNHDNDYLSDKYQVSNTCKPAEIWENIHLSVEHDFCVWFAYKYFAFSFLLHILCLFVASIPEQHTDLAKRFHNKYLLFMLISLVN